jgi:hypothetical protein
MSSKKFVDSKKRKAAKNIGYASHDLSHYTPMTKARESTANQL